ncbi:DUF305 domain-containing protein [Mycobacterium neglectum]|uniref:DUF305 domain-containing protein n=1 Tax=Mycobacterium neglectum TaxID=242737 RepID=UPI000BFEEAC1|nr:DUF305 domain-containing protein [Mycobacterium neglectum]
MNRSYVKFGITMAASLILMFLLTMSMIRTVDHFYLNLSNFYMALIMVAAMGVVMLIVMAGMFGNNRLNIALYAALAVIFLGAFVLGRTETFVGNEQFLKSMIPHHSRAILVCQESKITDPEIIALCDKIVRSQQAEIAEMKRILDRY